MRGNIRHVRPLRPGMDDPSRRAPVLVTLAVAALVLVAGVVVTVVSMSNRSDGSDDGPGTGSVPQGPAAAPAETPEDVVRAYLAGAQAQDCEVLAAHDVGEYDSVSDCEDFFDAGDRDDSEGDDLVELTVADVVVTSQTDQAATLTLTLTQTYGAGPDATSYANTVEYSLRNDDGRWNITAFESTSAG